MGQAKRTHHSFLKQQKASTNRRPSALVERTAIHLCQVLISARSKDRRREMRSACVRQTILTLIDWMPGTDFIAMARGNTISASSSTHSTIPARCSRWSSTAQVSCTSTSQRNRSASSQRIRPPTTSSQSEESARSSRHQAGVSSASC